VSRDSRKVLIAVENGECCLAGTRCASHRRLRSTVPESPIFAAADLPALEHEVGASRIRSTNLHRVRIHCESAIHSVELRSSPDHLSIFNAIRRNPSRLIAREQLDRHTAASSSK